MSEPRTAAPIHPDARTHTRAARSQPWWTAMARRSEMAAKQAMTAARRRRKTRERNTCPCSAQHTRQWPHRERRAAAPSVGGVRGRGRGTVSDDEPVHTSVSLQCVCVCDEAADDDDDDGDGGGWAAIPARCETSVVSRLPSPVARLSRLTPAWPLQWCAGWVVGIVHGDPSWRFLCCCAALCVEFSGWRCVGMCVAVCRRGAW